MLCVSHRGDIISLRLPYIDEKQWPLIHSTWQTDRKPCDIIESKWTFLYHPVCYWCFSNIISFYHPMLKILCSILQISKLCLRYIRNWPEIILKMTVTFNVFIDIPVIFYGTSPNYLESTAGRIMVRKGRKTRNQVPQRQLQWRLKALCPGLSLEYVTSQCSPSPPDPWAITRSGQLSKTQGRKGANVVGQTHRAAERTLTAWFPDEAQVDSSIISKCQLLQYKYKHL